MALAIFNGVISTKHSMNPLFGDSLVLTATDTGDRQYVTVFTITEMGTVKGEN